MTKPLHALAVLFAASSALVPTMALAQSSDTARDTIFAVQQRFATELDTETLRALDAESALALLSPSEREAMGQQFVQFDVNVPVTVYIARGGVEPFWFEDFGFEPTDLELQIRHETNWKVWKADFAAGAIGLGVNGLTSAQIGDRTPRIRSRSPDWPIITVSRPPSWTRPPGRTSPAAISRCCPRNSKA